MPRKLRSTREELADGRPRKKPIPDEDRLSLGCTMIDLAVSGGRTIGSVAKGHCVRFVGDSSSGKSWFGMGVLAEAANNPNFKDYQLIFDNAENGVLMDIERHFGKKLARRLRTPKGDWQNQDNSKTVRQFFYNLGDALKAGPCVYVLDSIDVLGHEEDEIKFLKQREARENNQKVSGDMGMSKARYISQNINRYITRLENNGSILIILNQTRTRIKTHPFDFGPDKTSAGGLSLKFYNHCELWTSIKGRITEEYGGRKRKVGQYVTIDVQKNRVSGWEGKVTIPFLRMYGIDDTGAMVDYMTEEGRWDKAERSEIVTAPEFGFKGKRNDLIKKIEAEGKQRELQRLVQRVWREIDAGVRSIVERKGRYA